MPVCDWCQAEVRDLGLHWKTFPDCLENLTRRQERLEAAKF